MKFQIKANVLKEGLNIVNHAVANITTTPILETIMLKVNFSSIVLISNNLEMAIEYVIKEGVKINSEGSFAIPSKLFTSLVSLIDDEEIEIELLSGNNLQIKTENGKTKIKGIDATEFPLIPTIKEEISISVKGSILKESIEKTIFSSAEGNIRPTLAGLYVNIKEGEIIFASTDSFRLSEYKTAQERPLDINFAQIIPNKTAHEIKGIIKDTEDVKIISGHNQVGFFFGNTKVYSRLLNGKFPDYTNFFPNSYSTKVEINRVDLIQALRKINLISKENNYSIKIKFNSNYMVLETGESQIGELDVKVTAALEGDENIIGINSIYFLEVLGVIESTHIAISFENALSPIFIKPIEEKKTKGEFRHIIMPLKI
ncbi:DNA polymerase III subunit beta [Candidatus Gracilibacteria bacterium]|nr:DNA polymerase III subunit beta [Candidatus Gracilibacteria bacterium]